MIRTLSSLGWLFLWVLFAMPLDALEIRQTIWGFDGRLVPDRFNPVSVLVDNPAPAPFEGALTLAQNGAGLRGTEYVQPIFLAPRTTRWVQFHVFVGTDPGNFRFRWGRGGNQGFEVVDELKLGAPACVWLRDSTNAFASTGAIKAFPDELFPTTVAATEGCDSVVLDHVPSWESARREAFLDWLKLGGTVHLLPAADGKPLVFGDGLEPLNAEGDVRYGIGRVVRHQVNIRDFSERYLADRGFPAVTTRQSQNPSIYDLENTFSQQLSSLTKPNVNWTIIHILAVAYIVTIGPLHYRYRRRLDYRVSILVFLGAVALFGTLFAIVGRRGYGESQVVNSLTIAHSLGGGRYDTTQWISAFATAGDIYTITHDAPANLYSPVGFDAGGNRSLNGKDGRIELDIPLYSARTFIHRGVMKADDVSVTVETPATGGSAPENILLRTSPGFPTDFVEARLFVGNQYYDLALQDGILKSVRKEGKPVSKYLGSDQLSRFNSPPFGRDLNPDSHRDLLPVVTARALNLPDTFMHTFVNPPRQPEPWRLCVAVRSPASFSLKSTGFSRERGWTLYVQDILPQ